MEEDEDEDVLLEGTSLYQHLQDTGFTDFEVVSSQNKRKEFMNNVNEFERASGNKNLEKWSSKFIKDTTMNLLGLSDVEEKFLESVSLKIIKTKLLEEEDLLTLEMLSPSIERLSSDPQAIYDNRPPQMPQGRGSTFAINRRAILIASTICMLAVSSLSLALDLVSLACVCALLLLLALGPVCLRCRCLRKFSAATEELNAIVEVIERTSSLSRRCLKFLNELNLMRRSINQKEESLDLCEYSQESALSQGTWQLLSQVSRTLRASHAQLQATMARCGLDTLHALFSDRFQLGDDDDALEASFSLADIKTKRNLTRLLSSTLLTELLLAFEASRDVRVFHLLPEEEGGLVQSQISLLERLLNLSRRSWLKEEPTLKTYLNPLKSYEKLKVDVNSVVTALSIHCRLLTYSAIYLKESLEDDNIKEDEDKCREIIRQSCEAIKNEMVSCNACLEEVVERSEHLFGGKKCVEECNDDVKYQEKAEEETTTTTEGNPMQTYGLTEPVIEDEVFEGTVSHNQRKETRTNGDRIWVRDAKKEKQTKKKQRERCKRVLQEIQPILQRRREMWQERESKALRRMHLGGEAEAAPGDSGLCSPSNGGGAILEGALDAGGVALLLAPSQTPRKRNSLEKTGDIGKDVNEIKESRTQFVSIPGVELDTDCDSEEERLRVYRRVRAELDEDEAMREEEEDEEEEEEEQPQEEEGASDAEGGQNQIQSRILLDRKAVLKLRVPPSGDWLFSGRTDDPLFSVACNEIACGTSCNAPDSPHRLDASDGCEEPPSPAPLRKGDTDWGVVGVGGGSLDASRRGAPEEGSLFLQVGLVEEEVNARSEAATADQDCFSCGDSTDEEEGEKAIDWSACGVAGSGGLRREREEVCVGQILFSGLPPSVWASGVRLRTGAKLLGSEEEVFGGVGEKENERESAGDDTE